MQLAADTMEKYLEALVANVSAKSATFAERIQFSVPSIICEVGQYPNEAFLLRSFVSLRAENNGDELALTVDITRPTNDKISVESDVSMDDGTIIATGPAIELSCASPDASELALLWSRNFDEFLEKSTPELVRVLSDMVAAQKDSVRRPV